MQALKRIKPSNRPDTKCHWWQVMYQEIGRDGKLGKVKRHVGINSEVGAIDMAARLNEESRNCHYWAEPNPSLPGRGK